MAWAEGRFSLYIQLDGMMHAVLNEDIKQYNYRTAIIACTESVYAVLYWNSTCQLKSANTDTVVCMDWPQYFPFCLIYSHVGPYAYFIHRLLLLACYV